MGRRRVGDGAARPVGGASRRPHRLVDVGQPRAPHRGRTAAAAVRRHRRGRRVGGRPAPARAGRLAGAAGLPRGGRCRTAPRGTRSHRLGRLVAGARLRQRARTGRHGRGLGAGRRRRRRAAVGARTAAGGGPRPRTGMAPRRHHRREVGPAAGGRRARATGLGAARAGRGSGRRRGEAAAAVAGRVLGARRVGVVVVVGGRARVAVPVGSAQPAGRRRRARRPARCPAPARLAGRARRPARPRRAGGAGDHGPGAGRAACAAWCPWRCWRRPPPVSCCWGPRCWCAKAFPPVPTGPPRTPCSRRRRCSPCSAPPPCPGWPQRPRGGPGRRWWSTPPRRCGGWCWWPARAAPSPGCSSARCSRCRSATTSPWTPTCRRCGRAWRTGRPPRPPGPCSCCRRCRDPLTGRTLDRALGRRAWAAPGSPRQDAAATAALDALATRLADGRGGADVSSALAATGARYVLLRDDLPAATERAAPPTLVRWSLLAAGAVVAGTWTADPQARPRTARCATWAPRLGRSDRCWTCRPSRRWRRTTARRSRWWVVCRAGPAMTAADLLDGPVRVVGPGADLPDWVSDDARRHATDQRVPVRSDGPAVAAGAAVPTTTAPGALPAPTTSLRLVGARSVEASSSAADLGTGSRRVDATAPAAVDGNLFTAWQGARGRGTGQWWRIAFDGEVDLGDAVVRFVDSRFVGPRVSSVRIETDRVTVDREVLPGGELFLDVDDPATRLTITVTSTDGQVVLARRSRSPRSRCRASRSRARSWSTPGCPCAAGCCRRSRAASTAAGRPLDRRVVGDGVLGVAVLPGAGPRCAASGGGLAVGRDDRRRRLGVTGGDHAGRCAGRPAQRPIRSAWPRRRPWSPTSPCDPRRRRTRTLVTPGARRWATTLPSLTLEWDDAGRRVGTSRLVVPSDGVSARPTRVGSRPPAAAGTADVRQRRRVHRSTRSAPPPADGHGARAAPGRPAWTCATGRAPVGTGRGVRGRGARRSRCDARAQRPHRPRLRLRPVARRGRRAGRDPGRGVGGRPALRDRCGRRACTPVRLTAGETAVEVPGSFLWRCSGWSWSGTTRRLGRPRRTGEATWPDRSGRDGSRTSAHDRPDAARCWPPPGPPARLAATSDGRRARARWCSTAGARAGSVPPAPARWRWTIRRAPTLRTWTGAGLLGWALVVRAARRSPRAPRSAQGAPRRGPPRDQAMIGPST